MKNNQIEGAIKPIKQIIDRLTQNTKSIFVEKLIFEAGEFGIGELSVNEAVSQLIEQNYLIEPVKGVVKRVLK